MNHGSFGAIPQTVLQTQNTIRGEILAQPDEWYFSGQLDSDMCHASDSVLPLLSPTSNLIATTQVCLLENATVATVTIARHWAKRIVSGDIIVVLSVAYVACINVLREYCEPQGAEIAVITIPFPCSSVEQMQTSFDRQLRELANHAARIGSRIRFAFLDHTSSQPALLLPIEAFVRSCRTHATADVEVAVDGAHAVGAITVDVLKTGADWYFSNLHKWAFAPMTATVLFARSAELMHDTGHPITSWNWQQGLAIEARFTGTRDYSAMLAVPKAVHFLQNWRSSSNETAQQHCHRRVLESAELLCDQWGTECDTAAALVATQYMVRLPTELNVEDIPGKPSAGIRATLRDRFNIEAAIGNFGERGNYVRLSYAIYNTEDEIHRLANAVLQLLHEQS